MDRLQRYRGHFYNWYDTRTLEPLRPMYVSTVDSGNLAGHLLTLAAGLDELDDQPISRPQIFAGLGDTLDVLAEAGAARPDVDRASRARSRSELAAAAANAVGRRTRCSSA